MRDRCCDRYHYQSDMGRQSAHVHHACRRPQVLQGALACVLIVSVHNTHSGVSVTDGFSSIYNSEGIPGLWRGTSLALVGVSSGAVQFMAYEELKRWGFEQKRRQFARAGKTMTPEDDKLVCIPSVYVRLVDHSLSSSHAVEHGLYRHVRCEQIVCACDHVSIPSHSFTPTSAARLLLFVSVSRVLSDHTE